jgi:hypothetical protein
MAAEPGPRASIPGPVGRGSPRHRATRTRPPKMGASTHPTGATQASPPERAGARPAPSACPGRISTSIIGTCRAGFSPPMRKASLPVGWRRAPPRSAIYPRHIRPQCERCPADDTAPARPDGQALAPRLRLVRGASALRSSAPVGRASARQCARQACPWAGAALLRGRRFIPATSARMTSVALRMTQRQPAGTGRRSPPRLRLVRGRISAPFEER